MNVCLYELMCTSLQVSWESQKRAPDLLNSGRYRYGGTT